MDVAIHDDAQLDMRLNVHLELHEDMEECSFGRNSSGHWIKLEFVAQRRKMEQDPWMGSELDELDRHQDARWDWDIFSKSHATPWRMTRLSFERLLET